MSSDKQQEQPIGGIRRMFDNIVKDVERQGFNKVVDQCQEEFAAAEPHQEPTAEEIEALTEDRTEIEAQERRKRARACIKKILEVSNPHSELSKIGVRSLRLLDQIEKGNTEVRTELDTAFVEFQQLLRAEIEQAKEKSKETTTKKKHRPTKAEMVDRNRVVVMVVAEITRDYDRLPTVPEIVEKTELTANQIYATVPYNEGRIAKKSAILTTESTGGSVTASEQFGEKSVEHSRANRISKSDQLERDRLIDESIADDARDEKQHKRYLRNKKGLTRKSIKN